MTEAEEQAYIEGSRIAWRRILLEAIKVFAAILPSGRRSDGCSNVKKPSRRFAEFAVSLATMIGRMISNSPTSSRSI